jgi:hypothetical protein
LCLRACCVQCVKAGAFLKKAGSHGGEVPGEAGLRGNLDEGMGWPVNSQIKLTR